MTKKSKSLKQEEMEFLDRILCASSDTVYGIDYEMFVMITENALKLLDDLDYFVYRNYEHNTLDLSLAGLIKNDTEKSRRLLAKCDAIYDYLVTQRKNEIKTLLSSSLAIDLKLSDQVVSRCLQFLNASPGITLTETEPGHFDVHINTEIVRFSSFTDFAKDCINTQENIRQSYNLDGLGGVNTKAIKKTHASANEKKIEIFSTALFLINEHPNSYRDGNQKLVADQLAEAICVHYEITLDCDEGAPLERDTIRRYLSPVLSGNYSKLT